MSRLVSSLAKQSLSMCIRRHANFYEPTTRRLTCESREFTENSCHRKIVTLCAPAVRHERGIFDSFSLLAQVLIKKPPLKGQSFILCGILTYFGLKKDEEPESELIMTMKRGILSLQRGEFKKAERMLHIALKLAQEQQNTDAITYIYDLLANVAYEAQELQKAEKLFVTVLQRELSSGIQENDNKVLHISLKLASIYKEFGNPSKAEEGFKFCENHLRRKIEAGANDEDTLILWAMTLDWYARFVLDQGRYKEAFQLFEKAYRTSVDVNGEVHEQNVVLLNDLGTVCCLQDDYEGAIKYLEQAVKVGKHLPDMEDIASIYINLGTVYIRTMMFEEARKACQEGWRSANSMKNKEALDEANDCLDILKMKAKDA